MRSTEASRLEVNTGFCWLAWGEVQMDADGERDEAERIHEGVARVWGPLPFALTSALGAHAPVCSCVLRPVLDTSCLAGVEEEVLHDALPAPDATREALLQRLARSTAFSTTPGLSPPGEQGTATSSSTFKYQNSLLPAVGGQARRVTYAEPSQPQYLDTAGARVARMRGYGHLYRHRKDKYMCRPMPPSLCKLWDALFTQVCGKCPLNARLSL